MRELSTDEITVANGGLAFLAPLLFAELTITASGVANALGIGAGIGAVVGGVIALTSED